MALLIFATQNIIFDRNMNTQICDNYSPTFFATPSSCGLVSPSFFISSVSSVSVSSESVKIAPKNCTKFVSSEKKGEA